MSEVIIPDQDFIVKNYEKTVSLLEACGLKKEKEFLDTHSNEYMTAPASTNKDYNSCFPGGLCYHNLQVLQTANTINKALSFSGISNESLLKVCVFHNFGLIGDGKNPFFVRTGSSWHEKRGIYYEYNDAVSYMKTPQRSLFLLQQGGVCLTEDEYLAILLHEGLGDDANKTYRYKQPELSILLNMAHTWSKKVESKNEVRW